MNEELMAEISELCVTACEKYPDDNAVSFFFFTIVTCNVRPQLIRLVFCSLLAEQN